MRRKEDEDEEEEEGTKKKKKGKKENARSLPTFCIASERGAKGEGEKGGKSHGSFSPRARNP